MSYFKTISDLLIAGKTNLAESTIKDIMETTLNEASLADVSNFLHQPKTDIMDMFVNSKYFKAYEESNANGNAQYALYMFTMFVSDELGVNPKLFIKWKKNKEFIEWFNQNLTPGLDLEPVPPATSSWTNFDPEGIGAEFQDTIGGNGKRSNGVTSGHRENEFGKIGDADSVGNVSPEVGDTIAKASDATDVRHRDIGSDVSLTKDVDADGARLAKLRQNHGDTLDAKVDRKNAVPDAMTAKYGSTSIPGQTGNGAGRYNVRGTRGKTAHTKYSPKYNNNEQKAQANRLNDARNDPNVPEWATRSPSNFDEWEKKNGVYQG